MKKSVCVVELMLFCAMFAEAGAQDLGPAQFEARSRLFASASAFPAGALPDAPAVPFAAMTPGERNEVSRTAIGNEPSGGDKCGNAGKQSRSEARASAIVQAHRLGFDVLLETDVRAQGGFFSVSQQVTSPLTGVICIGAVPMETPATARSFSEVEVSIRLAEENLDHWLDLRFESQSKEGFRTIGLLTPEGSEYTPVSGEPVLLRAAPGKTHILRASFQDTATDSGRCCGKAQKATFRIVASVRPVTTLLQQGRAQGNLDYNNLFESVGLLATRNAKGQAVPICIASVIGPRTLLTAAHCVSRFGVGSPAIGGTVYFLQSPDFRKSLGRVREVVRWDVPLEYVETGGRRNDAQVRNVADVAILHVNTDLGRAVSLPGPEDRVTVGSDAVVVNYGPSSADAPVDTETLTWARSVVPVTVGGGGEDLLTVVTTDGRCGTEAGSPVFVLGSRGLFLAAVLVAGSSDCSSKVGPRTDRHLSWIRTQIVGE